MDRAMKELKAVKRRLSDRLRRALKEGRLTEERQKIEREAERAWRQETNGVRNGHPRSPK
jgi:hypothetical protein